MSKKNKIKTEHKKGTHPVSAPIPLLETASPPARKSWTSGWIAVFCLLLYLQSIPAGYVLDDKIVITDNRFTQQGFAGITDIFVHESFRGYFGAQKNLVEGDRYRPLSIATFAVEIGMFGKNNPSLSHILNILLYALTGAILYQWVQQFLPRHTIGLLAILFFVAHPLHVEAIANIKGRDEILVFLSLILCLYQIFLWQKSQKSHYLLVSFLLFLISLFSKESAITFLAVIPLTLYFFTDAPPRDIFKSILPLLAATIIYLLIRIQVIGYILNPDGQVITDLMNNPFYGMTFGQKTATIFYTLGKYIQLHFFPHPLTHDYYPYQIPIVDWSNFTAWWGLLLHFGLIAVLLVGWRKKSIYAYCAAYYLATMSIVSNLFFSVGTFMNERFAYQASWGFCLALGFALDKHFLQNEQKIKQKIGYIITVLLLIGYSWKTWMRVPDWKDNVSLNLSALKNSPNSARANLFYAVDLWEKRFLPNHQTMHPAQKKMLLDSMMPYFNKSLTILPKYNAALKMLAGIAAEYHKLDNNYDTLLERFYQVNRNGYEPFVETYLKYLTPRVDPANASKLSNFYLKNTLLYRDSLHQPIQAQLYDSLRMQIARF